MGSTSCKGKQRFWEFLFSIFTMGNATGSPTVKCFRFVCENLTIFPFGKRIVGKLDSTDRQLTGEHEGHFTISLYKRIRFVFQYSNSLFTQPTQTRQDSLVLSWPSFQFATFQSQIYWGLMKTSKLGWDNTKLSRHVCSCVHSADTDKTKVLPCPCRQCEQAIRIRFWAL